MRSTHDKAPSIMRRRGAAWACAWVLALVSTLGVLLGADLERGPASSHALAIATSTDGTLIAHGEPVAGPKRSNNSKRQSADSSETDNTWNALSANHIPRPRSAGSVAKIADSRIWITRPPVGQLLNAPRAPPALFS